MSDEPITHYMNTDLDLVANESLDELTGELEKLGVFPLHVTRGDDGGWFSYLETIDEHVEPEANIAQMLTAIESLPPAARDVWDTCSTREFNVGYGCGNGPWAFNHGLSNETLSRMAACGATFRVTLYPFRPDNADSGQCNA